MRKVSIGSKFKYFIHYLNWKPKHDCWIDESLISHRDDEDKVDQLKRSLLNSKVKSTKSSATKHDSEASNLENVAARDSKQLLNKKETSRLSSPAVVDMKSTRKRPAESLDSDSAVEPAAKHKHRKHLLTLDLVDEDDLRYSSRIDIPNLLKKQLVDEYSMIITHVPNRLLRLPKADDANVRSILSDYLNEKRHKLAAGDATQLLLFEDLFRGLERYFDKALPSILLYRQERAQVRRQSTQLLLPI